MSRVEWHGDRFLSELRGAVKAGLGHAAGALQAQIVENLNLSGSPSAPGTPPGNDTGQSSQSIAFSFEDDTTVRVGTNKRHMRYLEHGFTATGKMTVPLTPEAKHLRRQYESLRQVPNLVFVKTHRHSDAFLARPTGKGKNARTEFLFVLKSQITVQPRPWARVSLEMARGAIEAAFVRGASKAMAGAAVSASLGGAA